MGEDMHVLQRQAAERVQRMQEHSRRVFEEHTERAAALRAVPPPPPSVPRGMDTEQLLLLGLAVLLWRAHCRIELVLALVYLAM